MPCPLLDFSFSFIYSDIIAMLNNLLVFFIIEITVNDAFILEKGNFLAFYALFYTF